MEECSGMIGENNFLFYNRGRLFINSRVGCLAGCSYCYLDKIGIPKGKVTKQTYADDIIRAIEKNSKTIWRPRNTFVSFGCYSDPWDDYSKHHTKKIMMFLDRLGYKATLSTKQPVNLVDLNGLHSLKKKNFYFLISIPFAKEISKMEKGTGSLHERINSVKVLHQNGFNVAIYIKPFFEKKTAKSFPEIINVLQCIHVPVILGRSFVSSFDEKGSKAIISNSHTLVESESKEYFKIKSILEEYTKVYENSFQVFGD
jgi:DNA repair photolyase